ncbi:threonine synthase [Candidatus Bathyarchaeota archaeon]|nr:threonine synthase [Candidatus Bathyarchaeota archaeon]
MQESAGKICVLAKLRQPYEGLRCNDCKTFFEDKEPFEKCPRCNGLLDTVFDEDTLAEYSKQALEESENSMWRFRMFLPVRQGSIPVTAGEGDTPLRPAKSYLGSVYVKDETKNPTGTFKDRGASVAVTRLSQLKVQQLALASEGNAGCSFALYSQLAKIRCHVYLPRQANEAKVQLSRKLGARVTQVTGTIADAGIHAAKAVARSHRWYNASTFVTPFRHDGKGTMALEICRQLGWESPDHIVYPVGGGVGLVGMWKMFKILNKIGWIRGTPRIIAVQPSGCAPVVEAFNRGRLDVDEWEAPKTIANGLKIPKPLAGKWILESLRESRGIATKVSESEIHGAMRKLAREEGMLLEPSSATAFAAIPRLYQNRLVDRKDRIVVIATGSGLKTLENF